MLKKINIFLLAMTLVLSLAVSIVAQNDNSYIRINKMKSGTATDEMHPADYLVDSNSSEESNWFC